MRRHQLATGDVIIAPDARNGHGFTLSIAPNGSPQLWYGSYDEAVTQALAWASSSGVSVWRMDGDATPIPVVSTHLADQGSARNAL